MLFRTAVTVAAILGAASASPVRRSFNKGPAKRQFSSSTLSSLNIEAQSTSISFNSFDSLSSFSNFDSFFGVDDFSGIENEIVLLNTEQNLLACQETIEASIIQQELAVMQEAIKQVLLEQVCDVEAQAVLFQQFISGLSTFSVDLLRQDGSFPSFDQSISSLLPQLILFGQNNEFLGFQAQDLGFLGSDIGLNSVLVASNWNFDSSPASVGNALGQALQASSGFCSGAGLSGSLSAGSVDGLNNSGLSSASLQPAALQPGLLSASPATASAASTVAPLSASVNPLSAALGSVSAASSGQSSSGNTLPSSD